MSRFLAAVSSWLLLAGTARAAEAAPRVVMLSAREAFLAAAIGAMVACALVSTLLAGRVAARIHVSLALLVVLIGGFALLTLFGSVGRTIPAAGALVLLGLIGLFRLLNRFEMREERDAPGKRRQE